MKNTTKIPPHELGFDFDGVIADIGEVFLRLACEKHGYCSFTLEDLSSFQVEECIPIPADIVYGIFEEILLDSLGTQLKPMEGMIDVITDLARLAPVRIVTARSEPQPVEEWLAHFFPKSTCDNIHLIAMGDHDDKVRHLKDLKLNFFIDDRLETCRQIANADLTPVLFSHPWNHEGQDIRTVKNWQDIRTIIDTQ